MGSAYDEYDAYANACMGYIRGYEMSDFDSDYFKTISFPFHIFFMPC